LITVRGVECLGRADVVFYDYLVNPRILRHAGPAAELICLGHHGGSRIWPQEEITGQILQAARAGRCVVRLKGGDPAVFARGAEEIDALVEQGIPFEVVPGVTTALAAGSYAGVPLTHRHCSSAVTLVTGQEMSGKAVPGVDFRLLASVPGTLVVYMGVTTARAWTRELIEGGRPPETPALIVCRCSFPQQVTVSCTLGEVADHFAGPHRLRPPAIVIVGTVAGLPRAASWFEQLPLFGQTVLVTRPIDQAATLVDRVEELGAEVVVQPAIEIREPADWSPVDAALQRLAQFDWLVFSSANGVHAFLKRLLAGGRDMRALAGVRLAAIGPGTSAALAEYHLQVDCQPARFQAEDLAAALEREAAGRRFLLIRASRGREVLADRLVAAGGRVEQVVCYVSADVGQADAELLRRMTRGGIHWTTVTSSAIARSLHQLFGDELARTRLASISPLTSTTLRQLGLVPTVEAREATMASLLEAIRDHARAR
jgi:uroporphyrinogen III methyltransferase/synthase